MFFTDKIFKNHENWNSFQKEKYFIAMNCRHSHADLFLKLLNIHTGVLPKVKETNIQDCFMGFQSQNEAVYIHLSQAILRT